MSNNITHSSNKQPTLLVMAGGLPVWMGISFVWGKYD